MGKIKVKRAVGVVGGIKTALLIATAITWVIIPPAFAGSTSDRLLQNYAEREKCAAGSSRSCADTSVKDNTPIVSKAKKKKSDQDKSLSDTALYALCEIALVAGDINQVKACIADGYNPNYESRYGTPLEIASNLPETQRIEMAKLLLDAGARVNAVDRDGWTLLQWAAEKGEKDLVKLLLEHAANVNVRSKYINTPLHLAAEKGHTEVVKVLIAHGATVNVRDVAGYTPLSSACYYRHRDVVEYLLANGADVAMTDGKGQTALHLAVHGGDRRIVQMLLAKGADISQKDGDGVTALDVARFFGNDGQEAERNGILQDLMLSQSKIAGPDYDVDGLLRDGVKRGYIDSVRALLDKGAKTDKLDENNMSLLQLALFHDHKDVAILLLASGIDPNAKQWDAKTALHHEAGEGDLDSVKLLLGHKADVNSRDRHGDTPLYAAISNGRMEVAALLLAKGADPNNQNIHGTTILQAAVQSGYVDMARKLLDRGANVNAAINKKDNGTRNTLLHEVAAGRHKDSAAMAKLLLEKGAVADAKNDRGNTPLHLVAFDPNGKAVAEILISAGAAANARNTAGATPLHIAASQCNQNVVSALAATKDINIDAQDDEGLSALHFSAKCDDLATARILLKKGPSLKLKNKKGQTANDMAIAMRKKEMVKLLSSVHPRD